MSETYQGILLLWWHLNAFSLLLFPVPIKFGNAMFRRGHGKLPHSWPVVAIVTRKSVPRGYLTNSVSSLELFHQVLGARVSLFTEHTTWEELVQMAGSGKEYRVSATPNHCHFPCGKKYSCFPFDSELNIFVFKTCLNSCWWVAVLWSH